MSHSVIFEYVTKKYKMYSKNSEKILDVIFPDGYGEDFYALQNISFTADEGDVIGIIGVNGAGKSTLSNLITGVIPPTNGKVKIKGQASLIAIASGLNNELTGRENIELKCLMLGFNKKEIRELTPEIIEFADIGNFIDQPVKSYSSGMKSRLGFAISVNIDPDVLVIDEALSVGDQTFTDKCLNKMDEFKERGKTIFFISHSIGQIKQFCQKALWLEAGEVKAYGTVQEIIPQYEKFLKEFKAMTKEEQKNFKQLVLEKRSKLRKQENQLSTDMHEQSVSTHTRLRENIKRKSDSLIKRIVITFGLLLAVLGGAGYAVNSGLLDNLKTEKSDYASATRKSSKENVQKGLSPTAEVENKKDIRYVSVPSGFIRKAPDMESEAVSIANFGEAYEVQDSQGDSSKDFNWFKISDKNNQEGWISSKIVAELKEEENDNEIANKIDQLIGFYPSLKEAIPMIGKQKGEEKSFNYTEYTYEKDRIKRLTITVSDSSQTDLVNEIGEPQLLVKDAILYHGLKYDFVFTVLSNGKLNKLSVIDRE